MLQSEVESRFPEFLVPDGYVEFPRRFISLPKRDTLKSGLESAASRIKKAAGRAAAVRRPARARAALLEWRAQRKFHMQHRPRRGRLGVVRIKVGGETSEIDRVGPLLLVGLADEALGCLGAGAEDGDLCVCVWVCWLVV